MGDMSRCQHDGFIGYCDICSPGWEEQLAKDERDDLIYQRGMEKGKRLKSQATPTQEREAIMQHWDRWRAYIKGGGTASWPRDEFEMLLDRFDERLEAQATPEEVENVAKFLEIERDLVGPFHQVATLLRSLSRQVADFHQALGEHIDTDHADVLAGLEATRAEARRSADLSLKNAEQAGELAALKRGEFICGRCGVRKDGEHEPADF